MSVAFIANELKIRLLEHAPNATLPIKKLDLLQTDILTHYKKDEFDCIIAPLILLSQKDVSEFFQDIHRILAPGGIFLFSTLGHTFSDELEKLGDALLKAEFQLPVVDRESLQLHYDDMNVLLKDLEESGVDEEFVRVKKNSDEDIIIDLDVMYGYAIGTSIKTSSSSKIEIPVENIKIRKPL